METQKPGSALVRALPNVLVLVALGGLAYAGHRTGWKMPRVSELTHGNTAGPKEDWCQAHNVPDSRCLSCHPELGGHEAKDWCKEHGVPESKCTICHPEILTKGQAADWCREHGVPESSCTLCHPDIAVKSPTPPSTSPAKAVVGPNVKKDPAACQTHQVRIQFASADSVKKAGVSLAPIVERPMSATVAATGELAYDLTRVARLSARVPGTLYRVEKDVGAKVKQGDVLALVDAAEVGRAKSELLQALAAVDVRTKVLERTQSSAATGLRTQVELEEARAAVREARLRLLGAQQALANLGLPLKLNDLAQLKEDELAERVRLLGLPPKLIETLTGATTANLLPITAPLDGELVTRDAVAGEAAEPAKTLFVVADLAQLWLCLDVRLEDAHLVKVGQRVVFTPDANAEGAVTGTVSWIATAADEKTRTLRVRAVVSNKDGRLRASVFGSARIVVRDAPTATTVPLEAVHWEGCCHVVFVRLADDIFETRKVKLGAKSAGLAEVLIGLMPGEAVASHGSHVLKSELLKSNLGAGCCD